MGRWRKRRPVFGQTSVVPMVCLFVVPMLVGLAIFHWAPLVVAVKNSTLQFSPLNPDASTFVGLDNYANLFASDRFLRALGNTILYIGGKLALQIPLGLGLALLLNRHLAGRTIVRGAVFAALVSSDAVITLVWNILYTPDNGLFNSLISAVGIPTQPFLTSTTQALPSILVIVVWKDLGFTMLILLAGLQSIPKEYQEAASIDGAGPLRRLIHITLPMLKRMLLLATFMATIDGYRIITPVILTTQGGPENASTNLAYYMFEQAFSYQRMGEASATAMIIIIMLSATSLVQMRALRTDYEH